MAGVDTPGNNESILKPEKSPGLEEPCEEGMPDELSLEIGNNKFSLNFDINDSCFEVMTPFFFFFCIVRVFIYAYVLYVASANIFSFTILRMCSYWMSIEKTQKKKNTKTQKNKTK